MLTKTEKAAIAEAIAQAERQTNAELVVVIAPASDAYQSSVLLYGLACGSIIDIGLWSAKLVMDFPLLLAIQLCVISLFSFIPWLHHLCLHLVPKRIKHHRAAHRACEEYLTVSNHVPAATPITLLYISLAEHYAHILTSQCVREKIPATVWNDMITELTASIISEGLGKACIKTVQRCAELLAASFPEQGEAHRPKNHFIQRSNE